MPNLDKLTPFTIEVMNEIFQKINVQIENTSVKFEEGDLIVYSDVTYIDPKLEYERLNICTTIYDEQNNIIGDGVETIYSEDWIGFETIEIKTWDIKKTKVHKIKVYPKLIK